ncbi:MAG TPA: redoxin domain-containing protein [Blastocatellia bacterium]|nr:redoxin domain-containing protein [Blastocatellia bacterium]
MPMRINTPMPAFEGATEWVNGELGDATAGPPAKLTLVHFWSVSCGICKENLPRVAEWREAHRDGGLRVIAVHMPRYPADVDVNAVREAITTYGISEACAVDNEHRLRDAFQNEQGFVPAYYLFDAEGKLRGFAAGERGIDLIAPTLKRLLASVASQEAAG